MASPPDSLSSSGEGTPAVPASIADVLEWLRKSFQAERARELSVSYQFELGGERGGSLFARVDDGQLDAQVGEMVDPEVVFRLAADDFFGVIAGTRNPDLLFMERKIEIEGDLSLALKLRTLFNAAG